MSSADPSLSAAERIDAACDHFESEWKAGRRRRIDDYLAAVPEADREPLRQALVAVARELARNTGRAEPKAAPVATAAYTDTSQVPQASGRSGVGGGRPTRVGRFEVRGVLGAGAFGRVYRAFDPQLGREVALKVPLPEALQSGADRDRFLREARALATVSHPNVCPIHEVGEQDGRPYIVMALVHGQSLAAALEQRKGPLSPRQAALIARKIALGLEAAHKKGIVHRDLKPANVMFDRERKDIVVMDFGLARGPRAGDAQATQSGVVLGTPAYMSPEQARGDSKAVGPEADVFALGAILYELLTGRRPFTGSAAEVIGKVLHVDPAPPSRVNPQVDAHLEAICLRALAKDPALRIGSMREFASSIEGWIKGDAAPAGDTGRPVRTLTDPAAASQGTAQQLAEVFAAVVAGQREETAAAVETAVRKARTPRWVNALLVLIPLGAVIGLTALFLSRDPAVKVTVQLPGIDLHDPGLSFFLDGRPIPGEVLAGEIKLTPGKHDLLIKRGGVLVKHLILVVTGGRNPTVTTEDVTPRAPEPPSDWVPLFNGQELADWHVRTGRPGQWRVENREMVGTASPRETNIFHNRRLRDFTLRMEFRFDDAEARAALLLQPPWGLPVEVELRPEFGLADEARAGQETTGNIGWPGAPPGARKRVDRLARMVAKGEWNRLEVSAADSVVTVTVNEAVVATAEAEDLPPLAEEFAAADATGVAVGLQATAKAVRFRTVEFRKATATQLPDRAAAEQALSLGGQLTVRVGKNPNVTLKKGDRLPAGRFRIRAINCDGVAGLTDASLEGLRVGELPELVHLNAGGVTAITDAGVRHLRGAPRLESLWLGGSQITGPGLEHLTTLPALKMLTIDESHKFKDDGMRYVRSLTGLKHLSLCGCPVTKAGLVHLEPLVNLEGLEVLNTHTGGVGFPRLPGLSKLKNIDARAAGVDDAGLAGFAALPALENLDVMGGPITDDGVAALRGKTSLKSLGLDSTNITDAAVPHLVTLTSLTTLRVNDTKVTEAGLRRLRTALPRCNIITTK